jgi:hypothetical protein
MNILAPQQADPRDGKPSASGLYRIAACPASWLAEQRSPEQPSSAEATLGTALHAHMEHGTLPTNPEEIDAINWCLTTEGILRATYGMNGHTIREQRLWELYKTYSGQADAIFFSTVDPAALVIDYKFGRIPVENAGSNWQLLALSLLILDNYPEIEAVYAAILQPFVSRETPQVLEVTRDMQGQLRDQIHAIIRLANSPCAEYNPGLHQCRYCRAIDACPAVRNRCNEISQIDLKDWLDWSPEKKAEIWHLSCLAKRLAERVERRVREDLTNGNPIPGLYLSPGRTMFKITDPQAAYAQLADTVGITPEEFASCCTVSTSKIDAIVYKKLKAENPEYTTRRTDQIVRDLLASCSTTTTTTGTIKSH